MYWFLVLSYFLSVIIYSLHQDNNKWKSIFVFVSYFTFMISCLFYGTRNINTGTDTKNYLRIMDELKNQSFIDVFQNKTFESGFSFLMAISNNIVENPYSLLLLVSVLTYLSFGFSAEQFDKLEERGLYIITLISYPHFVNVSENVIRSGLSIGLLFISFMYAYNKKLIPAITFGLLSASIHSTGWMFVVGLLVFNLKYINLKFYFFGWITALFLGVSNVTSSLSLTSTLMVTEKINKYVNDMTYVDYQTGFRIDFFLFSLMPWLIYISFKYFIGAWEEKYTEYLKLYAVLNCVYLVFMNVPFADRFALNSWMMIPMFITIFVSSMTNKVYKIGFSFCLISCFLIFV